MRGHYFAERTGVNQLGAGHLALFRGGIELLQFVRGIPRGDGEFFHDAMLEKTTSVVNYACSFSRASFFEDFGSNNLRREKLRPRFTGSCWAPT